MKATIQNKGEYIGSELEFGDHTRIYLEGHSKRLTITIEGETVLINKTGIREDHQVQVLPVAANVVIIK